MCYASDMNERLGTGFDFSIKHRNEVRIELVNMDLPKRATAPTCWFVNSMSDFFGEFVAADQIRQMIEVMLNTPRHIYIILTKREERMANYLSMHYPSMADVPNIVWGTSAGTQKVYDAAMLHLLRTPAAIRMMSLEPLLEDVGLELSKYEGQLHWLIVGGESGKKRRDCGVKAIESAAAQCGIYNVPVFVKQDSASLPGQQGRIPDRTWDMKQFPKLKEHALGL